MSRPRGCWPPSPSATRRARSSVQPGNAPRPAATPARRRRAPTASPAAGGATPRRRHGRPPAITIRQFRLQSADHDRSRPGRRSPGPTATPFRTLSPAPRVAGTPATSPRARPSAGSSTVRGRYRTPARFHPSCAARSSSRAELSGPLNPKRHIPVYKRVVGSAPPWWRGASWEPAGGQGDPPGTAATRRKMRAWMRARYTPGQETSD